MVSARAKRVLRNVWKHAAPGLRTYGRQLAGVVDSEIGRRTAGTSYGALIPSASSFIPGSGLSLAGRGLIRRSRVKHKPMKGLYLPRGFITRMAFNKNSGRKERVFLKVTGEQEVFRANKKHAKSKKKGRK